MGKRIIFIFSWVLLASSLLFSQSLLNRLRVPITMKGKLGIGYDNNFLRLSDQEIRNDDVREYGITSTLDSPILKPAIKLIYSPIIINGRITNIVTSIVYSHFSQANHKSYIISNLSLELKLRSYSWIKFGIRDIPKYYLRNFHDRDLSNIDYYDCTFSSQKYFLSYSQPVKWIRRTWIRIYTDYTKEYYNPHFTEFDLDKYMVQFDLNHKTRKKHSIKLTFNHGFANNNSFGSTLLSASFNRSYVFDKMQFVLVFKDRIHDKIDKVGISNYLEQRYYDLFSDHPSIDNWKFYLDGRTNIWIDWNIMDNIGFKTWYQFRWRKADTQVFGDFEWVDEIKSYYKHEFWLEFSYEFASDILY